MSALPPPYDPNANREPSQPAPATNMYVVEPPMAFTSIAIR